MRYIWLGRSEHMSAASAVDNGMTLFDAADTYDDGQAAQLLAAAPPNLAPGDVVIPTKFGGARQGRTIRIHGRVQRIDADILTEESIGALGELLREGGIWYVGICEASAATLRRAHAVHPATAVQSEYSLWSHDVEAEELSRLTAEVVGDRYGSSEMQWIGL
jgi:aryl-alcohol dehydrogenase-like predicted oxidoreductase